MQCIKSRMCVLAVMKWTKQVSLSPTIWPNEKVGWNMFVVWAAIAGALIAYCCEQNRQWRDFAFTLAHGRMVDNFVICIRYTIYWKVKVWRLYRRKKDALLFCWLWLTLQLACLLLVASTRTLDLISSWLCAKQNGVGVILSTLDSIWTIFIDSEELLSMPELVDEVWSTLIGALRCLDNRTVREVRQTRIFVMHRDTYTGVAYLQCGFLSTIMSVLYI